MGACGRIMAGMRELLVRARPYATSIAIFGLLTALLAPVFDEDQITVASLLFLLVTLVVAARYGYAVGLAAAAIANLFVNFFFVPPLHRFTVHSSADVVGLVVFLAVAFVGAFMLSRLKREAAIAVERETEAEVLLQATRVVVDAATPQQGLNRLCEVVARLAGARGCSVLVGEPLEVAGATIDEVSSQPPSLDQVAVAREALRTGELAGLRGKGPNDRVTFVVLNARKGAVLRLTGNVAHETLRRPLFQALGNDVAAALERQQLASKAQRATELERSGEFKSILLSGVSHDLRSPLTAIKAAVSSLLDTSIDWTAEDTEAFLKAIDSQTDRLTRTVANLLQMSRLESGDLRPTIEAVEVGPLLSEVAMMTSGATVGREVVVRGPADAWVRADYGLLSQSLVNLVENAAKYSHPGGTIALESSVTPGRVVLSVTDSGPGIADEDLPFVFDKFYRGRRTSNQEGTGLGLALVKAMIERCGGQVAARNDGGRTSISISLPAGTRPA